MTREMLDNLLVDVPRHVVPDVETAWRAGAARRRRGHAAATVAVAAVALVIGLTVLNFDPQSSIEPAGGDGVPGYPVEVPRPLIITDLPERPGPMAGVIELGDTDWGVVDASGRTWRLPGITAFDSYPPALSPDGRWIGFMRRTGEATAAYAMLDLVTGDLVEIEDAGLGFSRDGVYTSDQRFFVNSQAPAFWSPDARWVSVTGGALDMSRKGPLLMGVDGEVRDLDIGGLVAGWRGPDRLVVVRQNRKVVTVDPDGQVLETMTPMTRARPNNQWGVNMSPDGERLGVLTRQSSDQPMVNVFSMDSGDLLFRTTIAEVRPDDYAEQCSPSWADGLGPLVALRTSLLEPMSDDEPLAISAHWGEARCTMWASDALAGPAQAGPGLLEWRYWGWLWWWKQILVGLVVAGAVLWLNARGRRLGGAA